MIYVWLTDREESYPSRTASSVMDYLVDWVFGDVITCIQNMLEHERNTIVFVDCLGGLSPEIHFSEKDIDTWGIDLRNMKDKQILSLLKG